MSELGSRDRVGACQWYENVPRLEDLVGIAHRDCRPSTADVRPDTRPR